MATKLDKTIKRELEHNGKLYTITLESDGGLNVTPENIQGDYRDAIQRRGAI